MKLALFILTVTTGCAQLTVGPDGTRRVTGFVHLEIPAEAVDGAFAGESLRVRTLGLMAARTGAETSLSLGYTDSKHTLVNRDSCVAVRAVGKNN